MLLFSQLTAAGRRMKELDTFCKTWKSKSSSSNPITNPTQTVSFNSSSKGKVQSRMIHLHIANIQLRMSKRRHLRRASLPYWEMQLPKSTGRLMDQF
jgi:hypothetical protein